MVVDSKDFPHVKVPGKTEGAVRRYDIMPEYIEHLLGYIDIKALKPLKIVANPGNGGAGPVLNELAKYLPFEFIKINEIPDGTFPNGVPNPLLVPNREATAKLVREYQADLGVAWDGDFDRCFLFDEKAEFIEGYYIVGLLAEVFLRKQPGAKIMYDPRLTWNTEEIVTQTGGVPVMSKTGHAFIKERMRAEDAVYGGEMSAHHYFRDFGYCDSGMIPWLLVLELLCVRKQPLSTLVAERIARFPSPGEINSHLSDPQQAIQRVSDAYSSSALSIDYTDGLSLSFDDWRFNLRSSNTEPVVRLNVESRGDVTLMQQKTAEILSLLRQEG